MRAALVVVAALGAGCKTRLLDCSGPTAAPLWGADAQNRSFSRVSGPSRFARKWLSQPFRSTGASLSVTADDTILLLDGSSLVSLDPTDGHVAATLALPALDPKAPLNFTLGADGSAYAFSFGKREVFAIDHTRSYVRWAEDAPCGLVSGPLLGSDGALFVSCIHQILALDACDGAVRWSTPVAYPNYGEADAIDLDGALIGHGTISDTDAVVAFAEVDGHALWSTPWPAEAHSSFGLPVIGAEGSIYEVYADAGLLGMGTGFRLVALSPLDGKERWSLPFFSGASLSRGKLAVGPDGTIFLATDAQLIALAPSGAERWRAPLDAGQTQIATTLMVDGRGVVFVSGIGQKFAATRLWVFDPNGALVASLDASSLGWCVALGSQTLYCSQYTDETKSRFQIAAVGP